MPTLHRGPAALLACVLLAAAPTHAAVVFNATGTSAAGNPVAFQASFGIVGDVLTLTLANTSPQDSRASADVLGSFYFDIVSQSTSLRPALAYQSASGYVWLVKNLAADIPFNYTPPAIAGGPGTYVDALTNPPHVPSDLMATKAGDFTWQFKSMNPALAPLGAGFGIGTVGNSGLTPNNFNAPIVDQVDFTIFKGGDIDPVGNLADRYLVENTATFTFTGLTGYSEADIVDGVTFGLGTGPDSLITEAPEPAGVVLALGGMILGLGALARRWKNL